jgi:diguanylate cyclase (GGDEF)-like protein/PAS domain S-box-containing protein
LDPVARATRRRALLIARLIAFDIAIGAILAALVYVVLDASRQAASVQTKAVADNLAAVAKLNVEGELDRFGAVLNATADEIERLRSSGLANDAMLRDILSSRLRMLKGAEALRLTDSQGTVRWGNDVAPDAPMNVQDRDYFRQAAAHPRAGTIVSRPLQSRSSGHWVIGLIRPLTAAGEFDGLLYVTIAASHFQSIYSRYELGDQDAVTLRNTDDQLIARRSPGSATQGDVGEVVVSAEMMVARAKNPLNGSFVSRVAVDGVERTTSYRALDGWPFVVYAGLNNARFIQNWTVQAWTVCSLAALSWVLVVIASRAAYRSSAKVAKVLDSLREQTRQTQALLRVASDGIHIVDQHGVLVEMSDSFAEMLRSSREQLMGRHIFTWDVNQDEAKIAAWLAKVKVGDRQRVDVQHRRDDGTIIEVELHMRAIEIAGKLLVFGSTRDVTDSRRMLREQTSILESDLVGMVKVERQTIVWKNRAFERLFGYSLNELAGQPLRILYGDDETFAQAVREASSLLEGAPRRRFELRMVRRTGEPVWIAASGVRLSASQTFWMMLDITGMKHAHDQLAHAAYHDALTGLPNRLLMHERLTRGLAVASEQAASLAVCFLDLDGFKAVNDQQGHEAGDLLLVEVARRLSASLGPADAVFRIGGDEFVLMLAPADMARWQGLLARLLEVIAQPIQLNHDTFATVHATIGVAVSAIGQTAAETLLDRADLSMLRGKRLGKGQVWWSEAESLASA